MKLKLILSCLACAFAVSVFGLVDFAIAGNKFESEFTIENNSSVKMRVSVFVAGSHGCKSASFTRSVPAGETKKIKCDFNPKYDPGDRRCLIKIVNTDTKKKVCKTYRNACDKRTIKAFDGVSFRLKDAPQRESGIACDGRGFGLAY